MKTSRQQVLDYIRGHHLVTSTVLSRALAMTPANARHHLDILQDQGVVQVVSVLRNSQRGRPAKVYGLTREIQDHNLERLAIALRWEIIRGEETRGGQSSERRLNPDTIRNLSRRLVDDTQVITRLEEQAFPGRGISSPENGNARQAIRSDGEIKYPMATRLFQAIQRLNEMHYGARWEARATAPRVIFESCPYRGIIDIFPEMCQVDTALLEELTNLRATQTEKLVNDSRGGKFCAFDLKI